MERAELDRRIARVVNDHGGWVSAHTVWRHILSDLPADQLGGEAPTLALVARRLSEIPGLHRTILDGKWFYRPRGGDVLRDHHAGMAR